MNIKDILAKAVADLTDIEKAFVREHQEELSDEEKETVKDVLGTGDGSGSEEGNGDGEAADDAKDGEGNGADAADKAGDDKVEASEKKTVKISAAEFSLLRSQADKGAQAFAELEKMQLGVRADKMTFSQTNTEGHFLPKQKDGLVSFLLTLSEKQRDQFSNLISHMPKLSKELFSEVGDGGSDVEASAAAEVDTKVKEVMKASEKMTYSDALRKVFKENPGLETRYNEAQSDEQN